MEISPQAVTEFCALCDWAHQASLFHKSFFDDNPQADKINRSSKFGYGFGVLSGFTLEYTLLQIVKLHDKAVTGGRTNLTVDYILNHRNWPEEVRPQLTELAKQLDSFASKLRHVRNKGLSHNDLPSIMAGGVLGGFEKDEDVIYFERLGRFADIASRDVRGVGFAFNPFVGEQFKAMAAALADAVGA